jgi:hypothetical protein
MPGTYRPLPGSPSLRNRHPTTRSEPTKGTQLFLLRQEGDTHIGITGGNPANSMRGSARIGSRRWTWTLSLGIIVAPLPAATVNSAIISPARRERSGGLHGPVPVAGLGDRPRRQDSLGRVVAVQAPPPARPGPLFRPLDQGWRAGRCARSGAPRRDARPPRKRLEAVSRGRLEREGGTALLT